MGRGVSNRVGRVTGNKHNFFFGLRNESIGWTLRQTNAWFVVLNEGVKIYSDPVFTTGISLIIKIKAFTITIHVVSDLA